jgi:voltage-gated potassium channel
LTIKKTNPEVYVIAELLQRSSEPHARELGVDEVVIRGNVSSMLISNAVINPGVSKLVSELFSPNGKIKFSEIAIGPEFIGKSFQELKSWVEKSGNMVVALRKGDELIMNPEQIQNVDASHAIVLSPNKETPSNLR